MRQEMSYCDSEAGEMAVTGKMKLVNIHTMGCQRTAGPLSFVCDRGRKWARTTTVKGINAGGVGPRA